MLPLIHWTHSGKSVLDIRRSRRQCLTRERSFGAANVARREEQQHAYALPVHARIARTGQRHFINPIARCISRVFFQTAIRGILLEPGKN